MRHRARRPLLDRLRRAPRELVVASALLLVGGVAGVSLAVQDPAATSARSVVDDDPGTSDVGAPVSPQTQEPPASLTDSPSDRSTPRPSRSGRPQASPSLTETPGLPSQTPEAPTDPPSPEVTTPTEGSSSEPADTGAPNTTASTVATSAETWTVSVDSDESASYECSLDGGAYEPCGGTVTYRDLKKGQHTLAARATDGAGNTDPSPAQITAEIPGPGKGKG